MIGMTAKEAIEIVARHAIVSAVEDFMDSQGHEAYPDIGEHDWNRVAAKIVELTPDVDFKEAYALLSGRAG